MSSLWGSLAPLAIGSAVVPVQIIITVLLLRSASGKRTAAAWVAGMATVRLLQGVVFGLLVSRNDTIDESSGGSSKVVSWLLLVVAVLLLASAVRSILGGDDPDAPPPKWLAATATMTPGKAYAVGAGLMAVGVKFWVFTLSAITAIGAADTTRSESIVAYLVFVLVALSVHLTLVIVASVVPSKADALLDGLSGWLTRNNRVIMIVVGLVFGLWFLQKALDGLGVI